MSYPLSPKVANHSPVLNVVRSAPVRPVRLAIQCGWIQTWIILGPASLRVSGMCSARAKERLDGGMGRTSCPNDHTRPCVTICIRSSPAVRQERKRGEASEEGEATRGPGTDRNYLIRVNHLIAVLVSS